MPNSRLAQRALVLQGGGALGAYELGVFKALYKRLLSLDNLNHQPDRQLFDIIAGTSAGAINAAILVGNFVKTKSWKNAIGQLEEFWNKIKTDLDVSFWIRYWDEIYSQYSTRASKESARRYYSAKYFLTKGAPHVFSAPTIQTDAKFFDNGTLPNNIRLCSKNDLLRQSIEDFVRFPITTGKNDPRLLLVSVDIAAGTAVTFDSHSTKTEYWTYNQKFDRRENHIIKYPKGIEIEHVIASASIPIFYNYMEIEGRKFWDGSVLNNTPLREVIHKHKEFWMQELDPIKLEAAMWDQEGDAEADKVRLPDLEAYIVNLWPRIEEKVPEDNDGLKDRINDISFSDKTEYDERSATIVTDYIDLVKTIRNMAVDHLGSNEEKNRFRQAIDVFLKNNNAKIVRRNGSPVKYEDLIKGRFRLTKVVRIERKDDEHSISNKLADYSKNTVDNLIAEGQKDVMDVIR